MGISFKLSRRGRRLSPPPRRPPSSSSSAAAADDDGAPPPAASPDGGSSSPSPLRLPHPPWVATAAAAARLDGGVAARSDASDRNGTDPVDLDLEPSFTLNLFPDGYSIGDPSKGMLLYLIGDEPEKKPYNKASASLLSDIEHGCLPQGISHDIPCKFLNGNVVCEVRDYRSFLSNAGDSPGDDIPKVNRVALRLGTEHVVKYLSSILDSSCTYHDQLIAESLIINSLQPRLNLDPTPCLERLCNSVGKKIDLGLFKERQHTKYASPLNVSTDRPEKYTPKDCDASEGAAGCIENTTLVVLPSRVVNRSSLHCPSYLHIDSANSTLGSDPDNSTRHSSTIRSSSAIGDKKQSTSSTALDNLLESHEQRAHVASFHVDYKNGQSQRDTFLPEKRKGTSNLPFKMHEHQNGRTSNKNARLSLKSSKVQCQNSTATSNEGLKMVSSKELPVEAKVDQDKDIRVQQKKPMSLLPTNCPHLALSRNKYCVEEKTETASSLHTRNKKGNLASILDIDGYCIAELKGSRTPSVTSCSENSGSAAWIHHEYKAATDIQPTTSNELVSGNATVYLNHKISLKGASQTETDVQMKQPCENRSSEESGATDDTSCLLGIFLDTELSTGHTLYTTEPDFEKSLSEAMMTTQKHAPNGITAKIDGPEASRPFPSCSISQLFSPESAEGSPYIMQEEVIPYYPAGRTNYRIIRRLIFHRVQYFCRGIIDQSHHILCLLESDAPDDHQIAVERITGNEHIHIGTLPTYYHASKFVDQYICLMKQDGYTLCNAAICNEFSDHKQFEYFTKFGSPTGECPQDQMFSPCVAKSIVINERKGTGRASQRRLPEAHANVWQQGSQQWVLTEQSQAFAEAFHSLNPPSYYAEQKYYSSALQGQQQYNNRLIQGQGLPLAYGVCPVDLDQYLCVQPSQEVGMDQDQYLSVQPSQEVGMDQYFQGRHDIPGFSERCARNTRSYDQRWHQVPTQSDGGMYQGDIFPAFGTQLSNLNLLPPPPTGRSMLLHDPVYGTQASSLLQFTGFDDGIGGVGGAPFHLPVHLDCQYLSPGAC